MDPELIERAGCPLPTDGRIAGVWLEVCLRRDAPCDEHEWIFPRQELEIGTDRDVLVRFETQQGPIDRLRCVNLDPGVAARWGPELVFEATRAVYLPEPGGFALLAGAALVALLERRRRQPVSSSTARSSPAGSRAAGSRSSS